MNKKRCMAALAGAVLCLSLAACGDETPTPTGEKIVSTPVMTTEPTTEPTTAPQGQSNPKPERAPDNTLVLQTTAETPVPMKAGKRDVYDNGSYYYTDSAEDGSLRSISSCYVTTIREGESEEDYATRRALGLAAAITPGVPYQMTVVNEKELSDAIGYPVYLVNYYTGSDEEAVSWTVYLIRNEHYSYQYAFAAGAIEGLEMEKTFVEFFKTLKLEAMKP